MIYVKVHIRCDMFVLDFFFFKRPVVITQAIQFADYASLQSFYYLGVAQIE